MKNTKTTVKAFHSTKPQQATLEYKANGWEICVWEGGRVIYANWTKYKVPAKQELRGLGFKI